METTHRDAAQEVEETEQTLPGIGPQVGVEELRQEPECAQEIALTADEMRVLDLMRAQADRYEWFAARLDRRRQVDQLAAILLRPPAGPGLWEAALVELSLSSEEMAHNLLEQWQPPVDDPELGLFLQICRSRARRQVRRSTQCT